MPYFMKYLSKIHRCSALYRAEQYAGTDISCYEDTYIKNICINEGLSQDMLAKILCVHKSNVARHVSSLESKGYVIRVPAERDKRIMLVYPTEKARRALDGINAVFSEWNRLLLQDFDESEREQVRKYLEKLSRRAESIVATGEKE